MKSDEHTLRLLQQLWNLQLWLDAPDEEEDAGGGVVLVEPTVNGDCFGVVVAAGSKLMIV